MLMRSGSDQKSRHTFASGIKKEEGQAPEEPAGHSECGEEVLHFLESGCISSRLGEARLNELATVQQPSAIMIACLGLVHHFS